MSRNPRLEELLVERALGGLTAEEQRELRALGGEDDESFDQAAAALMLASMSGPGEPIPTRLAEKLLDAAPGASTSTGASRWPSADAPAKVVALPTRGPTPPARFAWVVAAAGVALAVGGWTWALTRSPTVIVRTGAAPAPPSASVPPTAIVSGASSLDERAKLLARTNDARVVPWKVTKDPAARNASGDVVWSAAEQRGFMRFVGLEPNDKTREQYQLWIFDKDRDTHYPVDGGVFDVPSSAQVVIPITARLRVSEATLFAVTVERPGGVVVSKRKRIVLAASTGM